MLPNGDGTFRFIDTRRVVACEACFRRIAEGQMVALPTPAGGVRFIQAPAT